MNKWLQNCFTQKTCYGIAIGLLCLTTQNLQGSWFWGKDERQKDLEKKIEQELSRQRAEQEAIEQEVADFENKARAKLEKKSGLPYAARSDHYKEYYPLPYWPYYSNFFYHREFIQVAASFQTASEAYASNGSTHDLSKLVFAPTITVQEILLASKLVAMNKLVLPCADPATATLCPDLVETAPTTPGCLGGPAGSATLNNKGYFLGALANQKLEFDASEQTYQVALSYTHNFLKGDIAAGLHLPVVVKSHRLSLETKDIDCAIKANIDCIDSANPDNVAINFSKRFGTLEKFVDTILARKCIKFNHKSTEVALGDLSAFMHGNIYAEGFSRIMLGGIVVIPTGKKRDSSELWPKDFGNGGFVELGVFASALWGNGGVWNPYVHTKLSVPLSARVNRRTPRIVTYAPTMQVDGTSPSEEGINLVLGESLGLKSAASGGAFSLPDSTIRGFADSVQRIRLRPGPEWLLRLGNTFGNAPKKHGYVDLYYDLIIKGRDHASKCNGLYTDVWEANTDRISHTVGLNYSYQFDEHYRLRFGGSYVFAGRNTPVVFGLELGFNADF